MSYKNVQEIIWIERGLKTLLFIALLGSLVSAYQFGVRYYEQQSKIEYFTIEYYGLPTDNAQNIKCHQGMLHYQNEGRFTGLLAFNPIVKCDLDTFTNQHENEFSFIYKLSVFMVFLSLFFIYQFRRQKK